MSQGKLGKKTRVLIVVVALGFVGVLVFGLSWWLQLSEYERLAKPEAIIQTATDAQEQALVGEYDKAHDTINKAFDNPSLSEEAKLNLSLQQGAIYESQQKYDEAMQSYRNAEALQENLGVIYSIANLAQIMGDNDLAAAYYKKAIPLIPEDDPLKDQRKRDFENWVSILEGRGPVHE